MDVVPYRSALVAGLGVSGEAAARLLASEGTAVCVLDRGGGRKVQERADRLRNLGVKVVLDVADTAAHLRPDPKGEHARTGACDVCIVSPGIPADDAWLAPVAARGIPLLAELELGASRCAASLLAVTGSNGKSTFVKFCAAVLEADGYRCVPAGNYGVPLCDVVLSNAPLDWVVVEVSSFQLETVHAFRPEVAVLLNLQADHLDRHGDMERYAAAKARLFDRLRPDQTAVIHETALDVIRRGTRGCPAWVTFGCSPRADYRYTPGKILYAGAGQPREVSLRGTSFDNPVMGCMAAAALAALHGAGLSSPSITTVARGFVALPHRMQELPALDAVRFIDDSKATNLSALVAALKMVDQPVRLIAGGILKEKVEGAAKEMLVKKVKSVYLVGQSANTLRKKWGGAVPCSVCGTLKRATRAAWRDANCGEIVLLSPGCASFDQFENYQDRGARFQNIVESIRNRKGIDDED